MKSMLKFCISLLTPCALLCSITCCSTSYDPNEWTYFAEIKSHYKESESQDSYLTDNKGQIGRGAVNEYLLESGEGDFKNCYLKRSLWSNNDKTMADVYGNKNGGIVVCHFVLKDSRYILTHYHLFVSKE